MNTHIDSVENRAIIGYLLFVALKRGHVQCAMSIATAAFYWQSCSIEIQSMHAQIELNSTN